MIDGSGILCIYELVSVHVACEMQGDVWHAGEARWGDEGRAALASGEEGGVGLGLGQ